MRPVAEHGGKLMRRRYVLRLPLYTRDHSRGRTPPAFRSGGTLYTGAGAGIGRQWYGCMNIKHERNEAVEPQRFCFLQIGTQRIRRIDMKCGAVRAQIPCRKGRCAALHCTGHEVRGAFWNPRSIPVQPAVVGAPQPSLRQARIAEEAVACALRNILLNGGGALC